MLIPTTPPVSLSIGATLFVDAINGNDTAALRGRADKPFLTPTTAAAAAQTGDTIVLGVGTFDITALTGSVGNVGSFNLPNGVNLTGQGPGITILKSTAANTGCILNSGGNNLISNLTVQGSTTASAFTFPIGCNYGTADLQGTGVVFNNVNAAGWSDCVYFKKGAGDSPSPIGYTFNNCNFSSNYDTFNIVGVNTTWTIACTFNNCNFNAISDGVTGGTNSRGVAISSGGSYTITLNGTTITTSNPGGGNNYSLYKHGAGALKIGPGCVVDTSITSVTSGSIVGSQSQILGTGGTTISPNANLGSTATATLTTNSDDSQGQFTLTPGGSGITTGTLATLTFGSAKRSAFPTLTPANAAAQALATSTLMIGVQTTPRGTGFDLISGSAALTSGTAYVFNYRA